LAQVRQRSKTGVGQGRIARTSLWSGQLQHVDNAEVDSANRCAVVVDQAHAALFITTIQVDFFLDFTAQPNLIGIVRRAAVLGADVTTHPNRT
jgi:hypothetical protein